MLVDHATQLRYMLFPSHDISFFTAELPTDISSLFDLVVSIDVLEHIDDDAGFVRSLYNATTVGGTLILHTPAIAQRRFLAEFEDHHEHVREGYSASNLTALLSEAGYNDVRIRPTFGKLGAIAWEGFALARRGNALAAATLPICYALGAIDSLRIPPTGNGLLATARR